MPDSDKDLAFDYLTWRDAQMVKLRERLIEKKAADASALTLLFLEGL